jgi:hypothetical protein
MLGTRSLGFLAVGGCKVSCGSGIDGSSRRGGGASRLAERLCAVGRPRLMMMGEDGSRWSGGALLVESIDMVEVTEEADALRLCPNFCLIPVLRKDRSDDELLMYPLGMML